MNRYSAIGLSQAMRLHYQFLAISSPEPTIGDEVRQHTAHSEGRVTILDTTRGASNEPVLLAMLKIASSAALRIRVGSFKTERGTAKLLLTAKGG